VTNSHDDLFARPERDTGFDSEHHARLVTLRTMGAYADRDFFDKARAAHAVRVAEAEARHQRLVEAAGGGERERRILTQYGTLSAGVHVTELLPGMKVAVGRGGFSQGRPAVVRTLTNSALSGIVMVDFAGTIEHLMAFVPPEHRTRKTRRHFRYHRVDAVECQPISDEAFDFLIADTHEQAARWAS
jgi:hypothetical protein